MKKFGTRLISAVLAGCMMTSVLPVSAFALEESTEFEGNVSAQENSDAPAAVYSLHGGEIINEDFIAKHGGSNVYSMSNADTEEGAYKEGIVIDAENADVVINVTGDTTFDKKDGNKDDCANFITVRRANSVTVNAEGQTITTAEGASPSAVASMPKTASRAPQCFTAATITGSVTTSPHAICAAAAGRLTISP